MGSEMFLILCSFTSDQILKPLNCLAKVSLLQGQSFIKPHQRTEQLLTPLLFLDFFNFIFKVLQIKIKGHLLHSFLLLAEYIYLYASRCSPTMTS